MKIWINLPFHFESCNPLCLLLFFFSLKQNFNCSIKTSWTHNIILPLVLPNPALFTDSIGSEYNTLQRTVTFLTARQAKMVLFTRADLRSVSAPGECSRLSYTNIRPVKDSTSGTKTRPENPHINLDFWSACGSNIDYFGVF